MFALVQHGKWQTVSEKTGAMMVADRTHTGERYNGYEYLIYIG